MKVLIYGITGQDGSYLSEFYLDKGYEVYGVNRRASTSNEQRLEHIDGINLIEGDITDPISVNEVVSDVRPNYIFNLAAQSHVFTSFHQPAYTFQVNAIGQLNILEAVRRYSTNSRVLFAATSEMWGSNYSVGADGVAYQDETTHFEPQSPYATAKLAGYHLTKIYRQAYNMFACSTLCFNHESPRRGDKFVTRKITKYVADLYYAHKVGCTLPKLKLGNLLAYRDWGHAKDFCRAFHAVISAGAPEDYVVCTGETHSVEDFVKAAFEYIGISNYHEHIEIDPALYRPAEVDYLLGSCDKIAAHLGWKPNISFNQLVIEMVEADINAKKSKNKNN